MSDPSFRPRKRQRTSTSFSLPPRIQPSRRSKQIEPAARPQARPQVQAQRKGKTKIVLNVPLPEPEPEPENPSTKTKIILHVREQQPESEQEQEIRSAKSVLVLRHNIYPQWRHLPFAIPQKIKLNIAINPHEAGTDVVYYGPLSTTGSRVVPGKQDTSVHLELPRKAIIVTTPGIVEGEEAHVMLFGHDMEDALMHKERFESFKVLGSWMWPDWYPSLTKVWGGEAVEGVLTVKNIFDGTYRKHTIRTIMDLEACRISSALESVKLDFKKKSGLSVPEVQDIFLHRTEIKIVLSGTDTVTRGFEIELHSQWTASLGLPKEGVGMLSSADVSGFWHGSKILKGQLELVARQSISASSSDRGFECRGVILDVSYLHAIASTVKASATASRCQAPAVKDKFSSDHGCHAMRGHIRAVLEQEHGLTISTAAFESKRTYAEILEHMVDSFELSLGVFEEDGGLLVLFPEGVHFTSQQGHSITVESDVIMCRWSVMAIVHDWVMPLVKMAKERLRALDAEASEHQQRQPIRPHILMTGYWTQLPYIVTAFRAALRNEGLDDVSVMVDEDTVAPGYGTKGSLWSMTASPDGSWEIDDDEPGQMPLGPVSDSRLNRSAPAPRADV